MLCMAAYLGWIVFRVCWIKISNWNVFYLLIYRFNNYVAYAESKLANILHANELTRRLKVVIECFYILEMFCFLNFLVESVTSFFSFETSTKQEERVEITANSLHPGTIHTNIVRNDIRLKCKFHLLCIPVWTGVGFQFSLVIYGLFGLIQVFLSWLG